MRFFLRKILSEAYDVNLFQSFGHVRDRPAEDIWNGILGIFKSFFPEAFR